MDNLQENANFVDTNSLHPDIDTSFGWEHYCYTTKWIMDNFPPNDDFHHFELMAQREKEYKALCEFYEYNENDFEPEMLDINEDDEHDNYYSHETDNEYSSSSDSENDDFEIV